MCLVLKTGWFLYFSGGPGWQNLRSDIQPGNSEYFLAFSSQSTYNTAMEDDQLYLKIKHILVDQFEVDESKVSMDANLYQELEIDSIDAVDLMVQLKELTGKKIPPEEFKEVRTIGDVLATLSRL